jgi:hypothetical protein
MNPYPSGDPGITSISIPIFSHIIIEQVDVRIPHTEFWHDADIYHKLYNIIKTLPLISTEISVRRLTAYYDVHPHHEVPERPHIAVPVIQQSAEEAFRASGRV